MISIRGTLLPALMATALAGSWPAGVMAQQTAARPPAAALERPGSPARPPAATLERPGSPTRAVAADGFIQRWLVLEPIRRNGSLGDSAVQAAVRTLSVGAPTQVPHDGDTVTVAGTALRWHAFDTKLYNFNLFHFAYALNRPTSNVLFWAVTVVDAPRDMPGVRLAIGSNAASIWWLNGQEVIGIYNDRQTVIDDGVSQRLTLRRGRNIIRAAVINAGGATDFCARFLDERGNPIRDLVVTLNPGS